MRFGSRYYAKFVERSSKQLQKLLDVGHIPTSNRKFGFQGKRHCWRGKNEFPENHINDKRLYYRREYLKSEHWKILKRSKLRINPSCERCGSSKHLDIHHLNYRNLYDVLLTDLQTLCRRCHKHQHAVVVQ